jgi:hypothetical protein
MLHILKNLLTVLAFFLANTVTSQSTTLVHKNVISPYFDEWLSKNDFTVLNNTVGGPVRIYTSIFDVNNNLVLGTDTPVFNDYFDTLNINDTLNTVDIFPIDRIFIDTLYASSFEASFYFPYGNYSMEVVFLDTSGNIIDSVLGSFYIDSLIGPTLVNPKDNREIYYPLENSIPFTFLNRDIGNTVFYKFILKEVPLNFDLGNVPLEEVLLDTTIIDKVSFNIIGDDTLISFNEYGVGTVLDTNTLYVWAIREFTDTGRKTPIIANNGFSTPFLFKLTSRSSATLEEANSEFFNCSDMSHGFENGTLNGWVCGIGHKINKSGGNNFERADGIIIDATGAAVSGRHTIVTNGIDPNVPGLLQVPVGGGSHALKLGNGSAGALAENATITFTVNSNNAIIKLRYAVVLQDPPNHNESQRPLFRTRVFRKRKFGGITSFSNLVDPLIRLADTKNPYFTIVNSTIVYGAWNCHQIDLSKFIGETVTLELATGDCSESIHFGYAYVDFCGAPSGIPKVAVNSTYCSGENVIANGSSSTNLTAWIFTVEECANSSGTRIGATEYKTQWYYGLNVQNDFNLTDFLATSGATFQCNKYYRVKLAGNNFCSDWVEDVKVIYIICPATNLAGPDRCVTTGVNTAQIGSNPKSGYSYTWSPTTCISSSTIANPIFNKTLCPPQTYPLKYTLTATYLGCSVTDDVYIFNNPPTIGTITNVSSNTCEKEYSTTVLDGNSSDLVWSYVENGTVFTFKGSPVKIPLTANAITINVSLTNPCGTTSTSFTQAARTSNYLFGPLPKLIAPTAMDPQNPSTRSLLIWDYDKPKGQSPAYGITWYNLSVYNRWGERIYDVEQSGTSWTNGDIKWDGTYNGQKVSDGVYVWILAMKNCEHKKTTLHTIMRFGCTGTESRKWHWKPMGYHWHCDGGVYQYSPLDNQEKEDITVINYSK